MIFFNWHNYIFLKSEQMFGRKEVNMNTQNNNSFMAQIDIITLQTDKTIEKIKSRNVKVGLVIKPKTPASAVFPYLKKIDMVLVMTVEPGFGGQSFMADMMPKVKEIKAECQKLGIDTLPVEVDGGISESTIAQAAEAGVDICVAGTEVFKADDAEKAITSLKNIAEK